ncbi:MAG: site-2 protease family protein [Phaeodactylibacter sp.]|nr:site-2 protease family protein [Phaeodactylibacter sp.]
MRGAFHLVTLFKIPVRIHWTFLLLLAWVIYSSQTQGGDLQYTLWSSVLVLTIFLCVVLHEFGHALTARRYGVQTRDIILSPIGGIARLNKLPEKPLQEFFVAIAGPMVNVGIALCLAPVLLLFFREETLQLWDIIRGVGLPGREESSNVFAYYAPSIFFLNLILAGFNMLPAFPMDGGRIFRALLSIRFGRLRATRVAALIGQVLAILLAAYGIWQFNLITVFIAAFVFLTATQEYRSIRWEKLLLNHTVGEVMSPISVDLYPDTPMHVPFEALQRAVSRHFIVRDQENQQVVGTLSNHDLLQFLKKASTNIQDEPVKDFMVAPPVSVLTTVSLKDALEQLQLGQSRFLLVETEAGEPVGTIDFTALQRFVQLQSKFRANKKSRPNT